MPQRTRITVGQGGVKLFKEQRPWRRDLQIRIKTADHRGVMVVDFPASRDMLELDTRSLPTSFEIQVRRRQPLHRLRHPALRLILNLESRPLRLLITGSGRCGTQTVARFLDGLMFTDSQPVIARHEPLSEYVVPALLSGRLDLVRWIQQGLGHNVEASPYFAVYPEAIAARRVIHLIRDGRAVVQSGMNRGWYQNDSPWNRLKPRFDGDAFAQSCRFWRLACERTAAVASETIRLEDLTCSPDALPTLCDRLGVVTDGRPLPHANRGKVAASWAGWTSEQHAVFEAIAGRVMDRYYPGWRADR